MQGTPCLRVFLCRLFTWMEKDKGGEKVQDSMHQIAYPELVTPHGHPLSYAAASCPKSVAVVRVGGGLNVLRAWAAGSARAELSASAAGSPAASDDQRRIHLVTGQVLHNLRRGHFSLIVILLRLHLLLVRLGGTAADRGFALGGAHCLLLGPFLWRLLVLLAVFVVIVVIILVVSVHIKVLLVLLVLLLDQLPLALCLPELLHPLLFVRSQRLALALGVRHYAHSRSLV
mmetsp:Transcript_29811/g.77064  ORF Transcript_29811/g.77064 Transcript_29811/m.77064 type:complete len:230 (+) Transcript_29811:71-760(+)